jgi:hypothetical protein
VVGDAQVRDGQDLALRCRAIILQRGSRLTDCG